MLENSGLQLTTPDRRLVRDAVLSLADGVKQLEHDVMLVRLFRELDSIAIVSFIYLSHEYLPLLVTTDFDQFHERGV